MLNLHIAKDKSMPLKVLCLGAHSDDIEIGCGGSVLRLIDEYPSLEVTWIVFSSTMDREKEAVLSAESLLQNVKYKDVIIKSFRDSFFPFIGGTVKEYFEEIKKQISPDVIFTHCRQDLHQDHKLISELTWNTFRDHFILEYEIIKYDGDLGNPNVFITLDRATCRRKVDTIFKCFKTQGSRSWFSEDVFYSLLRIRGIECNAPEGYAEAFYCRKTAIR